MFTRLSKMRDVQGRTAVEPLWQAKTTVAEATARGNHQLRGQEESYARRESPARSEPTGRAKADIGIILSEGKINHANHNRSPHGCQSNSAKSRSQAVNPISLR